ncbi:Ubiquitin carboxyl-terminal hydrolase 22 [Araneus ventricosus]|uniref:Ubiquitin carboxyl-terminal hydrolase n=1 Tax=Araneus ventricosus TaxID=182803 RepID=A0A4Y2FCD2_ARAVE|nr:Ubiquitin carboxyl-terminal hydrolase 22 [Araneus ventricosus]
MESIDALSEETVSSDSCAHLNAVVDAVKNNYHIVLAYYVTCIAEEASKRKADDAYCRICEAKNRRIHSCLECAFFGCFDLVGGSSHMKDHAEKNDHYFAININHGCLFCFKCDDYVYNKTFEDIVIDYKVEARKINGSQSYLPWMPKAEEISLLKDKIKKISDKSYIGLRGIVNIGSSCYVNCIIQVFMHNPVLRDFFLSDKHKCFIKDPDPCLMCEMFVLFQEFYSGITLPYDPMRFFHALQKFCTCRLGQEAQDCFELFQDILTGLQSSFQETHETDNCNCMIHQIFYGINEISRECSQCNSSSVLPLDYFMDILLDLKGNDDSLVEILKRKFLTSGLLSDFACPTCMEINTTYLRQTIKKLPAVICFRMNCFKCHSDKSNTITFKKKSTAFAFEDWIDMSNYLNSKGDSKLSNGSHISNSYAIVNRYYLFGVIFHKGDFKGGHYSVYVKQRENKWFECDDMYVYKRSLEDVLKCEPFLLFYYKQL